MNIKKIGIPVSNCQEMVLQDFFAHVTLTPDYVKKNFEDFNVDNLEGLVLRYIENLKEFWDFLKLETREEIVKFLNTSSKEIHYWDIWYDNFYKHGLKN